MALVSVAKMATMMNVTPRHVQRLANEPGFPRAGKGQYDAGKCLLWYVRYLQAALEKKAVPTGDGAFSGLKDERARSIRADAELKEIELAEKRGSLVHVRDVTKCFVDLVHMTKARIMALPPRIAPEVLGESSRVMVQAIVEKQAGVEEAEQLPFGTQAIVLRSGHLVAEAGAELIVADRHEIVNSGTQNRKGQFPNTLRAGAVGDRLGRRDAYDLAAS